MAGTTLDVDQLEELIAKELDRWSVPAIEVVAVAGGEVVVAATYGKRDIGRGLPATDKTLFQHGSTGKAFTAFLIGTLVDDGLLDWDTPIREYLPEFRLADPLVSNRVTVRDLLSHRTGLPRHDWAWLANPSLSREELIRRIRFLELNGDLRQRWQYSNPAYAAAGQLAGVVTSSTWEEQMRRRVFEPLGMSSTVTSVVEAEASADHARPYAKRDGDVVEVAYRHIDNAAPAGQVLSNARDISRWLLCHTGGGEVDGTRVVSEESLAQTQRLHTPMEPLPQLQQVPHTRFYGYCMGWLAGLYRGREWLWHNGGIDGFRTEMAIVPEARVGVALSANLHETQLGFALMHHVLDSLLGLEPRPWTDEFFDLTAKAAAEQQEDEAKARHDRGPSHDMDDYAGTYENRGYGTLTVTPDGDELTFRLGELNVGSAHRHFDTWDLTYDPLDASWPVTFNADADGTVVEAVIPLEPAVEPIRFRRRT